MKRVTSLFLSMALLFGLNVFAQEETTETPASSTDATPTDATPMSDSRQSIALNFGLQGIGLDYGYKLNDKFSLRGGFMTLPISITDFDYEFDGTQTAVNANVNFTHISVKADYYPFKNSSFKLIAGFGYFLNNKADATIILTENIYFGEDGDGDGNGDFVFTPDDIGRIDIGLDWTDFNPYFGIGFGRTVPNKSVGFGIDLGMFYMGSPDVSVIATGMLEDTSEEEAELEENLSEYAWLPQLNFRLSFRL